MPVRSCTAHEKAGNAGLFLLSDLHARFTDFVLVRGVI